jgi:hypothetical protein
VRWLQGLDDQDMKALLQGARALVYPSFEEGFGLPPLEAMALGTVAIAADAMSLPGVCGDGAWLFDPRDHRQLVALMQRALDGGEPVAAERGRGRARAASFAWARTADCTLQCYRDAIAAAKQGSSRRPRLSAELQQALRVIAASPFGADRELRSWQDRYHAVEQHARAVEANRDEILRLFNELRSRNGQPPIAVPSPLQHEPQRPRWSMRRRWRKIKARLRQRFGER